MTLKYKQTKNIYHVEIPIFNPRYLNELLSKNSFEELHWLIKNFGCESITKELTESYSGLYNLRRTLAQYAENGIKPFIIFPGDGSRFLTAAMFTFLTKSYCLAVDPLIRVDIFEEWRKKFNVQNLWVFKSNWEDAPIRSYYQIACDRAKATVPILVVAIHAHIDLDKFLKSIPRWEKCYVLSCCAPEKQFSKEFKEMASGEDFSVLSPKRSWKLYSNTL